MCAKFIKPRKKKKEEKIATVKRNLIVNE